MARIKNKPKEEYLTFLRKELAKKQGYNILTSSDCKHLSENMSGAVSSDTFRRLFNIITNKNTISIKSLNHCVVYCGFSDWSSFIDYYNQIRVNDNKKILFKCLQGKIENKKIIEIINDFDATKDVFDLFVQIILVKVIQKDKDFFENVFEFEPLFVDPERNRYETYYLIHLLSSLCQKHKWMQEIAIENYYDIDSRYGFESDFFIEWLVTPQFGFYRTLLHNYHNVKKNNLKANAFYHLVIADYYADIEDWINFNLHYSEIKKIDFKDIEHNILSMRLKGIELIYAFKFNPNEFDNLCFEIDKINFWYVYNDLGNRITSLLFICISLHKCEQYQIITNIIKKSYSKYGLITTQWGEQNWNHLKILYADSFLKIGQIEKSKEIFNSISDELFDFNFSPYTDKIYDELILNQILI
jgi:hypothetical protein